MSDEYRLGVKEFMERANPAARQALLGRLLEVDRQGTFKFTAEERQQMIEEYAHNVVKNGLACTANTCGNEKLKDSINQQVRQLASQQFKPSEHESSNILSREPHPHPSLRPQSHCTKLG